MFCKWRAVLISLRSRQKLLDDLEQVVARYGFHQPTGSSETPALVSLGGLALSGQS